MISAPQYSRMNDIGGNMEVHAFTTKHDILIDGLREKKLFVNVEFHGGLYSVNDCHICLKS